MLIIRGDVLNKASRYALRASRSVVVSLSLSRRNAASESEESRGSLFVVRESLPSYSNGLWPNLTAGRPTRLSVLATALHLPMVGYLTGKKRLWASPTHTAVGRFFCDLRPATCELRSFYGAPLAMTRPVTLAAPFCFKAWAQASKVAPVVKMSSTRRMCF